MTTAIRDIDATTPTPPASWTSERVRAELLTGLRYELIGPDSLDALQWQVEELAAHDRPTKRYLAGFLVPADLPQAAHDRDDAETEDMGSHEATGDDDDALPDRASRLSMLPSCIGLSVLVPGATSQLGVALEWGTYELQDAVGRVDKAGRPISHWIRTQRHAQVLVQGHRRQPRTPAVCGAGRRDASPTAPRSGPAVVDGNDARQCGAADGLRPGAATGCAPGRTVDARRAAATPSGLCRRIGPEWQWSGAGRDARQVCGVRLALGARDQCEPDAQCI